MQLRELRWFIKEPIKSGSQACNCTLIAILVGEIHLYFISCELLVLPAVHSHWNLAWLL